MNVNKTDQNIVLLQLLEMLFKIKSINLLILIGVKSMVIN